MTMFVYLTATILLGSIAESMVAFLSKCVKQYRAKMGHIGPSDMIDDFVILLEDRYSKLNSDRETA